MLSSTLDTVGETLKAKDAAKGDATGGASEVET